MVVEPMLAVRALTMRFGGIVALDDVSFALSPGTITGLIGPNGAGKTTCFNCVTRLYAPTSGAIAFGESDLLRVRAHDVVRLGIARTFQNVALFARMSVLENLLVGAHAYDRSGRISRARAADVLATLELTEFAYRSVADLSYGTRKTVELARLLMASPRLALLDEPAAGLRHDEIDALADTIRRLRATFDVTFLLVEHHMGFVMRTCDRIVVLDCGRKIAEGTPSEICDDASVVDAYLGVAG
ncbi:MAG: ABC transporter ATP-binding protein [Vulcanimicrobiaceae bacterium]